MQLSSDQMLLKSAKSLFSSAGFHGVSVKEIADQAGVNAGLISYHFGGKLELYRRCISGMGEERLAAAQRILTPARSLAEIRLKLELFAGEIIHTHLSDPEGTLLVHRECENRVPEVEDIFRKTYLKAFETLCEFLTSAKKDHYLSETADVHVTSMLFFGMILHQTRADEMNQLFFKRSLRNDDYRQMVVTHMVEIFLNGCSKVGKSK